MFARASVFGTKNAGGGKEMNLFDPARPKTPSGQAQILGELFVVPHVIIAPQPEGILLLSVMLRNYAVDNGYSYRFYRCPVGEIEAFLTAYVQNPEAALLRFFNWEPKHVSAQAKKSLTKIIDEIPDFL